MTDIYNRTWNEALNATEEMYPQRSWGDRLLYFPELSKWSDIFGAAELHPTNTSPNHLYFISDLRTGFKTGGYGGDNSKIKPTRRNSAMYSGGEHYHVYAPVINKKLLEWLDESLIDGLSSFELIDQRDGTFLLLGRSRSGIGSRWITLLSGDDANANNHFNNEAKARQKQINELSQAYKDFEGENNE